MVGTVAQIIKGDIVFVVFDVGKVPKELLLVSMLLPMKIQKNRWAINSALLQKVSMKFCQFTVMVYDM